MSEPFIAEVRIFAGNFAPRSWAFCNGQLLPISQNTALFSLVGTIYGGDGRTTFGLPNLQGRAAMHPGRGPGLTPRTLGQSGGAETVTLSQTQLPSHNHVLNVEADERAEESEPNGQVLAAAEQYGDDATPSAMSNQAVTSAGGGQAHNNMQPYIAINYIIALQGLFPSRS